ncbi:MAG: PGPGW domain-containing protein [Ignavibacteriaceae bacterium]
MKLASVKRVVVTVIGFILLSISILLIIFPGPAFIVIPIGLAILSTEYEWAKKVFAKIKRRVKKTFNK